jgi:peptide/nickel transport system ATP-binding protein
VSTNAPLLRVEGLTIRSSIAGRERTIVSDIRLEAGVGETIGIVGESGSGKSLTARAIIGLLPQGVHATGTIAYAGRNLLGLPERELERLRGGEIGLVFQDPYTMLNPLRRCGRHIDEMLVGPTGRRLSRKERRAEAERRLAEVGIDDGRVADRYPFELSGGMRQRVGIAAALARDPKVLIADEPSTALDVTTQRDLLVLMKSLQQSRGMTLILITHDLRVAFAMCGRIYVLYAGSVLETGPALAIDQEPLHPYTLGLLLSDPPLDRRLSRLPSVEGAVAEPDEVAGRCPFSPRCRWVGPVCCDAPTPLRPVGDGRESACIRLEEIAAGMEAQRLLVPASAEPAVPQTDRPLVQVTDLSKLFVTGKRRVDALAGVSIEVGENESVGLVGESGSGKTTLARCIVGLETPTSGSICVAGLDASNYAKLSAGETSRLRHLVQIVFQDPYSSLNPMRTIGSALKEAVTLVDGRVRRADTVVSELLTRVGLPADYAARKPIALSGGERQRVAIARALAAKPKLLICDEPVSALDVSVQAQILNLFASLRDEYGISYLFVTHDLAVVRQVVDRVYVMHRGRVVEEGPVDGVLDHPRDDYTRRLVASVPRTEGGWLEGADEPAEPALAGD